MKKNKRYIKNNAEFNPIQNKNDIRMLKKLLENMLDFLAEMPVDKYHDYREFRNLRLREYLIHKFIQKNVKQATKITNN
jgi:hypothetical protein